MSVAVNCLATIRKDAETCSSVDCTNRLLLNTVIVLIVRLLAVIRSNKEREVDSS